MRYAVFFLSCLTGLATFAIAARGHSAPASQPDSSGIPENARFACPMEAHPEEADPARKGAYFSPDEGKCPLCGMALKPLSELPWVEARRAAAGAEVAYTCPDHQHVFSNAQGECPRCGHRLEPFKLMYTCPDPQHASVVRLGPGRCPRCRWKLTPFRGVWLSPEMAAKNAPPNPQAAQNAAYRCPVHSLVFSDRPGNCPICAADLTPINGAIAAEPAAKSIPADAKYACPMEKCWQFAAEPGKCPTCGMNLKPIDAIAWAKDKIAETRGASAGEFVCPMHPTETSPQRGTCSICGMQLVETRSVPNPAEAPAVIGVQVDYLMEHYLALQKRFASDSTKEVALHALGLVGAADEVLKHVDAPASKLPEQFGESVRIVRAAALKLNGRSLDDDRVTFVALSNAMTDVVDLIRPSKERFPKIFVFHCPMTKGDWLQMSEDMANPFYGFKMLKCGEQAGVK